MKEYNEVELRGINLGRSPEDAYTAAWHLDKIGRATPNLRKIGAGVHSMYELRMKAADKPVLYESFGMVRLELLRAGYRGKLPSEPEYAIPIRNKNDKLGL